MLLQRRRFLKKREERHDTQVLDMRLLIEEPEIHKYLDVERRASRPLLDVAPPPEEEESEKARKRKASGSPGKSRRHTR